MTLSFICRNIEDTDKLAEKFSDIVKDSGAFVSLIGDIGAGKTAFVKLVCKHLGVKEKVTSPSFVILNEYKSGVINIYHFDLYRLESEGVSTIINELEEYSEGNILTFAEWAEFSENALPFDRVEIHINYVDENTREFILSSFGNKSGNIIRKLSL